MTRIAFELGTFAMLMSYDMCGTSFASHTVGKLFKVEPTGQIMQLVHKVDPVK